ncbi:LxmA leader domain family RiPP [Kineococcus arenarius]|uniref:LxmA leader domain family RiPP n=1 Tax=unclassified Kineococcus TaxID=2621656 RepID=UPI003D7D13B9
MQKNANVMDLVAGYEAYASVGELGVSAASDAPATTPVCAATAASAAWSSVGCSAVASGVSAASLGVTYEAVC